MLLAGREGSQSAAPQSGVQPTSADTVLPDCHFLSDPLTADELTDGPHGTNSQSPAARRHSAAADSMERTGSDGVARPASAGSQASGSFIDDPTLLEEVDLPINAGPGELRESSTINLCLLSILSVESHKKFKRGNQHYGLFMRILASQCRQ